MGDPKNTWTREHIVVLKVKSDAPLGTFPEWWESVGLPPPWEWEGHFPENVWVEEVVSEELA